jgi:hypothetical protein
VRHVCCEYVSPAVVFSPGGCTSHYDGELCPLSYLAMLGGIQC